jgi:hypothetical protein
MTQAELDTSPQQNINLEDEVKRELYDPKARTKDQREHYGRNNEADFHEHLHDQESFNRSEV